MKFIVSSNTLLKKLQILGGVINTSNTIPVLDHFLFDLDGSKLKITSSDLETTMISSMEVDSSSKGSVAIPSKLLIDTLKTFCQNNNISHGSRVDLSVFVGNPKLEFV